MTNPRGHVMMRLLIAGAALACALATPRSALAQLTAINELRPLGADQAVSIEVVSHTLVVEGWDRSEIQIVGEYDPAVEEVEINDEGATFRFEIEQQNGRQRGRRGAGGRLEVRVPRGARLDAETVSGSVTVTGFVGALDASSVSGRVDVAGNLEAVDLTAVSGRVTYTGNAPVVRLESVSGSVDFRGTAADVRIESVSGAVMMEGGAETIDAESVSGPVRIVSSVAVRALDANSVSGGVDFRGPLASGARVDVESHSGSVDLDLVGGVEAMFELESFSGSVDAELANMSDVVRNQSRLTPSQSLRFVTGSGAGRVIASSFSGGVRIIESR
jgi:DUF4097 and DUF4098 domain-containing protein YvlB